MMFSDLILFFKMISLPIVFIYSWQILFTPCFQTNNISSCFLIFRSCFFYSKVFPQKNCGMKKKTVETSCIKPDLWKPLQPVSRIAIPQMRKVLFLLKKVFNLVEKMTRTDFFHLFKLFFMSVQKILLVWNNLSIR